MSEGTALQGLRCVADLPFYKGIGGVSGDGLSFAYVGTLARGITFPAEGTICDQPVVIRSAKKAERQPMVRLLLAEPFPLPEAE